MKKFWLRCFKTLWYLGVLSPAATLSLSLDELKLRWKYLAEAFPNIIKAAEVNELEDEIVKLKILEGPDDDLDLDDYFKELSTVKM